MVLLRHTSSLVNPMPQALPRLPLSCSINVLVLTRVLGDWPIPLRLLLVIQSVRIFLLLLTQASFCLQPFATPVPSTWSSVPREQRFPYKQHLPIKVVPDKFHLKLTTSSTFQSLCPLFYFFIALITNRRIISLPDRVSLSGYWEVHCCIPSA